MGGERFRPRAAYSPEENVPASFRRFVIKKDGHWYIFRYPRDNEREALQELINLTADGRYNLKKSEVYTFIYSMGYDAKTLASLPGSKAKFLKPEDGIDFSSSSGTRGPAAGRKSPRPSSRRKRRFR